MKKKFENLFLFIGIVFSIYCSILVGMSWDEPFLYEVGKGRLKYVFSLGQYDYVHFMSFTNVAQFPGFYDTISAFISQMAPTRYEIYIHHLINLFFSLSAIFGISKLSKLLFNKDVSKIIFIIALFNPIFFGHMSINPRDTIIAFSNIWCAYFVIRYLQNATDQNKRKYFSTLIGLTIGFGMSIRPIFLGTLLPIIVIFFLDIFFTNIFYKKKISFYKIIKDLTKIFLISYFVMIIFWPDVHSNIFLLPYKIIISSLNDVTFGTPWGLLNGEFYRTINTPKNYLLINLFYKLPEFILITYIIFIYVLLNDYTFFKDKFKFFKTKISLSMLFLVIPVGSVYIVSLKIHDGLRYFLFLIPYLSIIPSLVIYYLIINYKKLINKFFLSFLFIAFLFFLINFISLTPYQYVYLNKFVGNYSEASKKFENDYWGISIKELANKIETNKIFDENKIYKVAFCGINYDIGEYYLKKIENLNFIEVSKDENYDYIIMTNRHNGKDDDKKSEVKSCFESYKGKKILSVKRNGLDLSIIMQKM